MKRTAKIAIGDWSDDGHGKCKDVTVKLVGKDVSNARMTEAYKRAVEEIGVDIAEVFKDYEASSIELDDLKKICDSGYKIHPIDYDSDDLATNTEDIFDDIPAEWFVDGDKEDDLISVVHLLMYYLSYGIEDFSYSLVKTRSDYIIGHYARDTPVTTFGYGLLA